MANSLVHESLAPSSHRTYQKALEYFESFAIQTYKHTLPLPVSIQNVMLFIAFCYSTGLAPSTVTTYISAISYHHKIANLCDPTKNFVVKKCLQGYQKLKRTYDSRLPVTIEVLAQLIQSLQHTTSSYFVRSLLKAMYLLAFYAFLRVGEFTNSITTLKRDDPILSVDDICFQYTNNVLSGVEIRFTHFKHSKNSAQTVYISCCRHEDDRCPVHALFQYLELRKARSGPLFSFMDGSPVSRAFFTKNLNLSLTWSGLSKQFYKGHSFRIGAATTAAASGVADAKIQMMGRWSSSAFKKYIRIPVLKF